MSDGACGWDLERVLRPAGAPISDQESLGVPRGTREEHWVLVMEEAGRGPEGACGPAGALRVEYQAGRAPSADRR